MNAINVKCRVVWNLEKHLTIDEMKILYKGFHSSIWQYMPKETQKWGLKVSCLECFVSKCLWNFEVYCRKEVPAPQPPLFGRPFIFACCSFLNTIMVLCGFTLLLGFPMVLCTPILFFFFFFLLVFASWFIAIFLRFFLPSY